jgi:hypothetical protein
LGERQAPWPVQTQSLIAMTEKEIKAYKVRLCREANPEKYKTYAKEWQKANREKCKVYMRNYYQRNKAARIAAARAWQAANPEKFKAMLRKAYAKRKARLAALSHA